MSYNSERFILYFSGLFFFYMQLFLKILTGIADSVDPDQTAPSAWSESALFAYAILSEILAYKILGHLLYLHAFCIKECFCSSR